MPGFAGLEINRTVNVQPLTAAALRHGDLHVLRCPTADRANRMHRMHRIAEQHGFIIAKLVQ